MADLGTFDSDKVEPSKGFTPQPEAWYKMAITESIESETKKKDGRYVKFVFQVIEGEYKGREHWYYCNLKNKNPDTVKYAEAELSAICRAVGVNQPGDSTNLHRIPLYVHLGLKKDKESGEMRNKFKGYKSVSDYLKDGAQPVGAGSADESDPWKKSN